MKNDNTDVVSRETRCFRVDGDIVAFDEAEGRESVTLPLRTRLDGHLLAGEAGRALLYLPRGKEPTDAQVRRVAELMSDCVPGIRCTRTNGCIMAKNHDGECVVREPERCPECGVWPWEACVGY